MSRSLVLATLALLGGCPPPTQYLVTDVSAAGAPVPEALVATTCGTASSGAALRTDATGRALLQLHGRVDARTCAVRVAKPGFPTVEATGVSICSTPACPATRVDLEPTYAREAEVAQ